MSGHDELHEALAERAALIGDERPLTLEQVKGRARGIRRRRMAVTGLAAAAVLAVAVPAGLSVGSGITGQQEIPPASQGPSPTPSTTPPDEDVQPTPQRTVTLTLDPGVDDISGDPGIPYWYDGAIHVPGTDATVATDATYDEIAPIGDQWLGVRQSDGERVLDVIEDRDGTGEVLRSEPVSNGLAVSADGTLVAFATPTGLVKVITEEGAELTLSEAFAGRNALAVEGIEGSGTCRPAESSANTCTVYVTDGGQEAGASYATSYGQSGPVGNEVRAVGGVSPEGWVTGQVSAYDAGSCSVMLDAERVPLWSTCEHTLGQFSPDGRFVLGHPAYRDGIGDGSVAILDAETGKVLVEAKNDAESQAFLTRAVWSADGSVVMTVQGDGAWHVLRLDVDGTLSRVDGLHDLPGDFDAAPIALAARP